MRKILYRLAAIFAFLAIAGCFSFETAPLGAEAPEYQRVSGIQGEAVEHVVASNYGWYFFNKWPLVCGNASPIARTRFVFFTDDVDERTILNRFMSYAERRECDVVDLNLFNNEEVLMTIGFGGLSLPLPYVVSFRDIQYSGVLVKRPPEARMNRQQKLGREMQQLLNRLPDGDVP